MKGTRATFGARPELKLSVAARFPDSAGACRLRRTAVIRGDQAMALRLAPRCC
jgi:hypothetical protein